MNNTVEYNRIRGMEGEWTDNSQGKEEWGVQEETEHKLCTYGWGQWEVGKGLRVRWEPGGGEQWREGGGTFVIIWTKSYF